MNNLRYIYLKVLIAGYALCNLIIILRLDLNFVFKIYMTVKPFHVVSDVFFIVKCI